MISYVFVYGTLKPSFANAHVAIQAGMTAYQEGFIEGFELYHLEPEGYPAIVPGPGRVYGGRLSFKRIEKALQLLDELEELHLTPPSYRREEVRVEPFGELAWVYIYNRPLPRLGASLIKTGLWLAKPDP